MSKATHSNPNDLTVYVSATDTYLSGWGQSEGKKNRISFLCENMQQAYIVFDNLRGRKEMTAVGITPKIPSYPEHLYLHETKTIEDAPSFYERTYENPNRTQTYPRQLIPNFCKIQH